MGLWETLECWMFLRSDIFFFSLAQANIIDIKGIEDVKEEYTCIVNV